MDETKKDDGGPAFPVKPITPFPGMTLRDWLAGQALAGMLADPDYDDTSEQIAAFVYHIADAMIEERSK